jgi:ABC-type siderophore export system fused ATPase/permease subunit
MMKFVMDMIMILVGILFVVSAFALLDLVLLDSHFINKLRDKFGKEIEVDATGDRIKQMWTKVCQDEMPELDETCMTLQRQEKFAQMIIQECVNSIENNVFTWGLDQAATKGFCVDAIIDHFGDEE